MQTLDIAGTNTLEENDAFSDQRIHQTTVSQRPLGPRLIVPPYPSDVSGQPARSLDPGSKHTSGWLPGARLIVPPFTRDINISSGSFDVIDPASKSLLPVADPGTIPRTQQLAGFAMETSRQTKSDPIARANRLRHIEDAINAKSRVEPIGSGAPARILRKPLQIRKDTEKPQAERRLSPEQALILQEVKNGKSVFFTGSAGTGKSFLLRHIIKELKQQYPAEQNRGFDAVAITAATGLAALRIGGITLHSFAGVGLGLVSVEKLVQNIEGKASALANWKMTQVLVVDEISMIDGELFDKLSEVGRIIRGTNKPFGGIQLVITGDFFQLAPIKKDAKYAFGAKCWSTAIACSFNLTQVFRQRDEEFIQMLNAIRYGMLTDRYIQMLGEECAVPVGYTDGIEPTQLYPTHAEVVAANNERLRRIKGDLYSFEAHDAGAAFLLEKTIADPLLHVRKGAQVMLLKNKSAELVNGLIGIVVDFEQDKTTRYGEVVPVVEFPLGTGGKIRYLATREKWDRNDGVNSASRIQIPLTLAWALSIHKAQGQTLDRVKVDLKMNFASGQAYVALSRATCLEHLEVLNFKPEMIKADPRVVAWTKELQADFRVRDLGN